MLVQSATKPIAPVPDLLLSNFLPNNLK